MAAQDEEQIAGGDRPHGRLPLLVKAMLLVLTTTLVPLAILGVLGMRRALDAMGNSARRDLQLVAELTATRLDQLFVDMQRMEGTIAVNRLTVEALLGPQPDGVPLHRLEEMLDGMLQQNPDLALGYVADAKGICLVSSSPDMVGRDYRSTREYMREALAGRQYVSEMNMGITTREPGVFFSGPVMQDGQVIGAVVLKLKGSVIDRICNDVNANIAEGYAAVADSRQMIISHPNSRLLYHSLGVLPPDAAKRINPALDYGVKAIESAGLDAVGQELNANRRQGNLVFTNPDGQVEVSGYARLREKPWTVLVVQPRDAFVLPLWRLARGYVVAFVIVGIVSGLLAALATWRLLRPVKALQAAAVQASKGDWSARAAVLSRDELGDLAQSFNQMMPRLQEQAQMQHALHLAMEVQRHLLPESGPQVAGLQVDGVNVAADETGGDYFDFLDLSGWQDGSLAVAVGDVTGHGISAALLMATARAMVRSNAIPPGGLAGLITHVNMHLCKDMPDGHFMTLMYAVIDRARRQVRLVSAGHDPILEFSPSRDTFRELSGNDVPLGLEDTWTFHEHTYSLEEDSILVLGTDGIWETISPDGEQFGAERLKHVICGHARESATEIKQAILDAVKQFRRSAPQNDDITAVVVKVMPMTVQADDQPHRLTIPIA